MVKKISIFLLSAFMLLSLSACGPNNRRNLRSEIDALLAEYPEYAEELEALKAELDQNPHNVYRIAEKLETLKPILAGIYDGYLRVKVIDLTNEILFNKDIHFRIGDKIEDLLRLYLPIEEDEETKEIKSIANTFIDPNYQLQYYLNNELLTNLKTTDYKSKDTLIVRNLLRINLSMLDSTVDQVVYKFIRNHASQYFTKMPVLDQYVVSAIKLLERNGYDVSLASFISHLKVEDYYRLKVYDPNSSGYVKTLLQDIINMINFGIDPTNTINRLKNVYGKLTTIQNNYVLLALGLVNVSADKVMDLLNVVVTSSTNNPAPDIAASALIALANYRDYDKYALLVNRYSDHLYTKFSASGIDHNGANCVSTASAIIALIANGLNPASDYWTSGGSTLISSLLQYENNGEFSWSIDGEIDTAFSTPQGFGALVAYKVYRDTNFAPVRLFEPIPVPEPVIP